MRIQSLSLTLPKGCNARCPFCVSRMTGTGVVERPRFDAARFRKACAFALLHDVDTCIITGKGEPTLYPDAIATYLEAIRENMGTLAFPAIELQTNGLRPAEWMRDRTPTLAHWAALGLTHVSVSVVHHDPEVNRQVMSPDRKTPVDTRALAAHIHDAGLQARISGVMCRGLIDSPESVEAFFEASRECGFDSVTVRPVARPSRCEEDDDVARWVDDHLLDETTLRRIRDHVADGFGRHVVQKLREFAFGGEVFSVDGHNLCVTNCLTLDPVVETNRQNLRQAIYTPDQHLELDWQYGKESRVF